MHSLTPLLFMALALAPGSKSVDRNGMTVTWDHAKGRLQVAMSAPTTGWIGIGFNNGTDITGTHLVLGRVVNGTAEVVEYYTLAPGDYRTITELGGLTDVADVHGEEQDGRTTLRFSLPVDPPSHYQRRLAPVLPYELLMAFSRDDDFKHHSTMRTSVPITL